MKKKTPPIPKNSRAIAPTLADSLRSRNSRTSSAGWAVRDSCQANSASTTTPPNSGPRTLTLPQFPLSPPCTMP